ncbi:MAG TPA: hypothetical protein PLG90_06175 [Ignavibacteria bacterium]|nr:hypothetical protein [Ignavibacteria bacterium]
MKRLIIFICLFILYNINPVQSQLLDNQFLLFNNQYNGPYKVDEILNKIKWDELVKYCKDNKDCFIYEINEDAIHQYKFSSRKDDSQFYLEVYNYEILRFKYSIDSKFLKNNIDFFDRIVYMKYVREYFKDIPPEFILDSNINNSLLESYYSLLGLGGSIEYGWICEYSSVGLPTQQRQALMEIMKYGYGDIILQRLLAYPSIEIRLYAFEALFYSDHMHTKYIENEKSILKNYLKQEDSLKLNSDTTDIEIKKELRSIRLSIKEMKDIINYSDGLLKLAPELSYIEDLKDSNLEVVTCENMGSYKSYLTPIREIITDDYLNNIIENFSELKKHFK